MSAVQLLENTDLDLKIRSVTIDERAWFVLSDFAKALGYRDAEKAKRHLRDSQYNTPSRGIATELGLLSNGGGRAPLLVTESGIYRLALRSQAKNAEPFQVWVEDEILPSVRRDGAYVSPNITPVQSIRLIEKLDYKAVLDHLAFSNDYRESKLSRKSFANMQNGFYKAAIGMTASEFREKNGLPAKTVVKEHLSPEQLKNLQGLSLSVVGELQTRYPNGIYSVQEFADAYHEVVQRAWQRRVGK